MTQVGYKRKLTSIFSADAVGCNRLMGDDEATTVGPQTSCNIIITLSGNIKTLCIFLCSLSNI